MPTYSSVPNVWEVAGSLQENFDSDSGTTTCSVTLHTLWDNRFTVAFDILDNRRTWPWLSGANSPRAFSVGIQPSGCEGTVFSEYHIYELAVLNVSYTNERDVTELITESIESEAEFVSLDFRHFRWLDDSLPLIEAEAPGKLLETLVVNRSIRDITLPISNEFWDNVGTVNANPYSSLLLQKTFPPETLLYGKPVLERKFLSDGSVKVDLSYKLRYQPEGWNHFYRGGKFQLWDQIVDSLDPSDIIKPYKPIAWTFLV